MKLLASELLLKQAESARKFDCVHYLDCLDEAVAARRDGVNSFSCHNCMRYRSDNLVPGYLSRWNGEYPVHWIEFDP